MSGAPRISLLKGDLLGAGFRSDSISIEEKEESRETIKQWLPGSEAENFIVSANVSAVKNHL